MKKFVKWLQTYAQTYIKNYVRNNKKEIVNKINRKIDLPFLSEKQEGELIESVYEIIVEVVDDKTPSK